MASARLLGHRPGQLFINIAAHLLGHDHVGHHELASERVSKPVRHPDVSPTVDAEAAATPAGREFFGLARIGSRKSRDMRANGIRHPDAVLLVDAEMEGREEGFARLNLAAFAKDAAFGPITFREINELVL